MCMYATGCISTSDCISGIICKYFYSGSPYQQCLEDPIYSNSPNCFITYGVQNSGFGCSTSSQCCNPFASCIGQQCVLQQSCIYYKP
jgi:hypothetical protein